MIALAIPESNIYFIKPGKGKVEAKLFFTESCRKNLLHAFCLCDITSDIYKKKAKHYSYIGQKSTKPDKNIAGIFYNPSSTPDDISQAVEKMFLVQSRSNTRLAMCFCFGTFNGTCTKGVPLEEEDVLELDHILEKHGKI
ncbi:hypothetical protein AVEN_265468-1 [Araneus ventricosus]|uniref:Uncharacterized protein n=1 Tax=Araneus ventricosus TaxID=182803 RepID=A0A4Y2CI52_ARAVE|nr:hypothetical protein AVEN_265468-1 [Araneus ventricosus]